MKKLLFLILILQSCTVQNLQTVNTSNPKVLFFLKHSSDSNELNKTKLQSWKNDLQKRYSNLYFVGKYYNVESSLSFEKQLKNAIDEVKPKYIFSYEFSPRIPYSSKNKYVFILSDTTGMIKDKVYHDYLWIGLSDISTDFSKLEVLK